MKSEISLRLAILDATRKPGEVLSCEAIAAFCGVTRARVYQLEAQALKNLRRLLEGYGLREVSDLIRVDGTRDAGKKKPAEG